MAGRGRSVLAQQALAAGSNLVECTPIAKVVKTAPVDVNWCQHCLGVAPRGMRYCSAACADDSAGLRFLERVDLSSLEALHREQQRKFERDASTHTDATECDKTVALLERAINGYVDGSFRGGPSHVP